MFTIVRIVKLVIYNPNRDYTDIGGGKKFRHDRKEIYEDEAILYPWEKHFAWRPVKVHGKYHWLDIVYRRKAVYTLKGGQAWEYGTLFDVLSE